MVVLLAVLLVMLVVSALLWPRQRPGALRVPTSDRVASTSGAVSGILAATRVGNLVCFAVRHDGATSPLVLPRGWGSDDRLDLLDPTGFAAAQVGDRVKVTGSPGPSGTAPSCPDRGRLWTVASVQQA